MENFSQKYYGDLPLTDQQHKENNIWFEKQMKYSKKTGKDLYIPELNTYFNSNGEEIKFDIVIGMGVWRGLETPLTIYTS